MKTLFKLGLLGAIAYGVVRLVQQGSKWDGLTEEDLRSRIADKVGKRVPPEKLEQIQDKAVAMARARGKLIDPGAAAADSA
jgi:hypothetical protein